MLNVHRRVVGRNQVAFFPFPGILPTSSDMAEYAGHAIVTDRFVGEVTLAKPGVSGMTGMACECSASDRGLPRRERPDEIYSYL
jgi:hypothetical protein